MFHFHKVFAQSISWLLISAATVCCGIEPNDDSMNQEVRSLLSNKCFACHGPDEAAREAELRLDTREGAIDWVIDLDHPDSSELLSRIASDDPDEVMPPPRHGEALTQDQQKLIRRWIEAGAEYQQHWSYVSPVKETIPEVGDLEDSAVIDRFVQAKLIGRGLSPSPEADRFSLIRRLAIDVTGLPPTLEEADRFVSDKSPDAYEQLVDHYLSQPAFGERWASVWLDLARYADSAGYAEDRKRTIWLYRDYVIKSYVENKSFDEFTIEQIAGDLLPDATNDQKIATAFHRNTLTNSEGGTADEEFRSAAVVDRVNTTMAVWMGTTMACAQCHTHKYDPITQKEYFEFYDFLNQTADNDRPDESPLLKIYDDDQLENKAKLESQIAESKQQLYTGSSNDEFEKWIEGMVGLDSNRTTGRFVRISLPGRVRILSLAEVQVFGDSEERNNLAIGKKAKQSSTGYEGPAELANDGNTDGNFENKSVTHSKNGDRKVWWEVDLGSEQDISEVVVWNRTDNNLFSRLDGYVVIVYDQKRKIVFEKTIKKATKDSQTTKLKRYPDRVFKLLSQTDRNEKQLAQLRKYFDGLVRQKNQEEIDKLQAKLNAIKPANSVPIMQSIAEAKRRETKVQIRGNYLQTGETVTAGTPSVFHQLPEDTDRNRLTLAEWLVDSRNPLTSRVVVNRYWEQIFGIGLVETSEEFGAQGELPSHPELLDWLAVDLMENGWDTKRLLRQILLSETYRQSSVADSRALEADPNNRLLARGPRVRLSAEMIRDQALSVSGLLSTKMFGPPVQPPQPKVGLKPAFTGKTTDWTDSTGEDRYRRGVYTEWRRSSPYPSMSTFDVNNREVCEVRRTATNTPLQALVTLNDPVYVEAAQALARRVTATMGEKPDAKKMAFAFRLCLIRQPNQAEIARLLELFEDSKDHFENDKEAAKLLAVDPLNPPKPKADFVELAAWTTVANVLLNLDEMLMKP